MRDFPVLRHSPLFYSPRQILKWTRLMPKAQSDYYRTYAKQHIWAHMDDVEPERHAFLLKVGACRHWMILMMTPCEEKRKQEVAELAFQSTRPRHLHHWHIRDKPRQSIAQKQRDAMPHKTDGNIRLCTPVGNVCLYGRGASDQGSRSSSLSRWAIKTQSGLSRSTGSTRW
jgi:hypothetical protein